MANFTPKVPAAEAPNYMRLVGDVIPNRGPGILTAGIGDLFEGATKGADSVIQGYITDKVQREVDAGEQQEILRLEQDLQKARGTKTPSVGAESAPGEPTDITYGGTENTTSDLPYGGVSDTPSDLPYGGLGANGSGSPLTDMSAQALPPGLKSGLDRAEKLSAVNEAGVSKQSDFLNRMNTLSKQLRTQFGPGYRQVIDREFSRHLGAPTANMYRRTLQTELNKTLSEQNAAARRVETWENQNAKDIIPDRPDYFTNKEKYRADFDRVQEDVARRKATRQRIADSDAEIANRLKRGDPMEGTKEHAEMVFTQAADLSTNSQILATVNSAGFKSADDFSNRMSDAFLNKNFTADDISQWTQLANVMETNIRRDVSKLMASRPGKDSKWTYEQLIGTDRANKILEEKLKTVQRWRESITNKEFGAAGMITREEKLKTDMLVADMYRRDPALRIIEGLKEISGGGPAFEIILQSQKGLLERLDNASRHAVERITGKAGAGLPDKRGEVPSMKTLMDDAERERQKPLTGATASAAFATVRQGILNPNVPQKMKENYAESLFKDPTVFMDIKDADKERFIAENFTPGMTYEMFKLKDSRPALWQMYKKFAATASVYMLDKASRNVVASLTGEQKKGLEFDPETMQIVAPKSIYRDASQNLLSRSIGQVNRQLSVLSPIIKMDKGGDDFGEVEAILNQLGIKTKAPAGTGKRSESGGQPEEMVALGYSDNPFGLAARPVNVNLRNFDPVAKSVLSEAVQAGFPVAVTSGYRSPRYNDRIGGARASQHLEGKAFDVSLKGLDDDEKRDMISHFLSDGRVGGFGYYPKSDSIHIDVRDNKAAWGSTRSSDSIGQGWPDWMTEEVNAWLKSPKGKGVTDVSGQSKVYPPGMDPRLGKETYPSLDKKEVNELWTINRDPENKHPYEPKTTKELETQLKDLGDGFYRLNKPVTQEFLKKLPKDVEVYMVPLDAFEGTTYGEEDRLIYIKRSIMGSDAGMTDISAQSMRRAQGLDPMEMSRISRDAAQRATANLKDRDMRLNKGEDYPGGVVRIDDLPKPPVY